MFNKDEDGFLESNDAAISGLLSLQGVFQHCEKPPENMGHSAMQLSRRMTSIAVLPLESQRKICTAEQTALYISTKARGFDQLE